MLNAYIIQELHRKVFELTLALYRVTDFFPNNEVLKRQLREKANEVFGSIIEYEISGYTDQEKTYIMARVQAIKGYLRVGRSLRFVRPVNLIVLEREYDILLQLLKTHISEVHESTRQEKIVSTKRTKNSLESNTGPSPQKSSSLSTWQGVTSTPGSGSHQQERTFLGDQGVSQINSGQQGDDSSVVWGLSKTSDGVTPTKREEPDLPSSHTALDQQTSGSVNERQKTILDHLKQTQYAKISDLHTFFTDISSKTIQRDLQDLVNKNMLLKEGEKRWTRYSLNTNV